MLVPVNHDVCYTVLQLIFVCACNGDFFTFFRGGEGLCCVIMHTIPVTYNCMTKASAQ